MNRPALLLSFALGLGYVTGCGGGGSDPKTAQDAKELSAMDELSAIPKSVQTDVDELTKPIDEVEAVINQITSIPKRHKISAGDMASMAKGTFDNGTVEVKVNGDVSAEGKAEIEAALKKLKEVVAGLKAIPEKVAKLTPKLVATTAKIPVLATKITTTASLAASNPFANAETKAKASADASAVTKIQADASKAVSDAQQKITNIPALATGALGKLGASFTSMN